MVAQTMARDSNVVVISSDEEEMDVDKQEEQSEDDVIISPALQADMARFPGKSRKQVLIARQSVPVAIARHLVCELMLMQVMDYEHYPVISS
jgi:hypothetical protein